MQCVTEDLEYRKIEYSMSWSGSNQEDLFKLVGYERRYNTVDCSKGPDYAVYVKVDTNNQQVEILQHNGKIITAKVGDVLVRYANGCIYSMEVTK